jgi:hypothetical protein
VHDWRFLRYVGDDLISGSITSWHFGKVRQNFRVENRADYREVKCVENRRLIDVEHLNEGFVEQNDRLHGL